jgi:hypothetical protein
MEPSEHFQRYVGLIESVIGVGAGAGENFPLVELDRSGHWRRVYEPLVIYHRLRLAKSADPELRRAAGELDGSLWSSLVRGVAGEMFGEQAWIEEARGAFGSLVEHQQASGEFLPPDAHANPETRWYEELTLLHAAADYCLIEPSQRLRAAVRQSAVFHLNETQPDHATAEPWGLLAFVQYAPALADQVLHAVSMQYPGGVTGPALLLLADALYGLRRVLRNGA